MSEDSNFFLLKRQTKLSPNRNFDYISFFKIQDDHIVTKETPVGKRVICSNLPDYYNLYFFKYHIKGEISYPHGGVTFYNANDEIYQSGYLDCVAIHPANESIEISKLDNGQIFFSNIPKLIYSKGDYDKVLSKQKKIKKLIDKPIKTVKIKKNENTKHRGRKKQKL